MKFNAVIRTSRRIFPVSGGQEQHVHNIAKEQTQLDAANIVLYNNSQNHIHKEYQSIKIGCLNFLSSDTLKGLTFVRYASQTINSFKLDNFILHSHGSAGDLFRRDKLKQKNIKLFHTFHASFGTVKFTKFIVSLFKKRLPTYNGYVFVNENIKNELENALSIKFSNYLILPSAIEPDFFQTPKNNNPDTLLMVGRLCPLKGFDIGLKVANRLYQKGLIKKVVIAGTGELLPQLSGLAKNLSVPVNFNGQTSRADLIKLHSQAKILLVPSVTLPSQSEGTPTVVQEAWACLTPVVASDSGGLKQLIQNAVTGYLSPEGDIDRMFEASIKALENSTTITKFAAQKVDKYTWESAAKKLLNFYES